MNIEKNNRSLKNGLNFFQLASILAVPAHMPFLIIGKQLVQEFTAGTIFCSIILGNLILWMIGISIISMVYKTDSNAIKNVSSYLGRLGGALIAIILLLAFLNWFAFQINASMFKLNSVFHFDVKWEKDILLRIGASFGLISTLLSIGGIRLFKLIATICLIPLFFFYLYEIVSSFESIEFSGTWGLSFAPVVFTVLLTIPGFINLPTIFKYSRSRMHSYLSLSLITFFLSFFQIATIWIDFGHSGTWPILMGIYVSLTLICANMLNIFFASACWEAIIPRFGGGKGFAIIGLLGTVIYTFLQISTPVRFFGDLLNGYFASLVSVLVVAYLVRLIVRHRPRPLEKLINLSVWLFGCVVVTGYEMQHFLQGVPAALAGASASILCFIGVIFFEETVWALKTKMSRAKLKRNR